MALGFASKVPRSQFRRSLREFMPQASLKFSSLHPRNADFEIKTAAIFEMVETARASGELWARSWTPKLLGEELREASLFGVFDPASEAMMAFALLRPRAERGEISLIAVFPAARGAGVLDLMISECDASYDGLDLEVRADNEPARRAYERNGFQVVGRRPRYYSDGVDAILYSRG